MAEQSKHEKRQAKIENLLNMAQEGIKDVFEFRSKNRSVHDS